MSKYQQQHTIVDAETPNGTYIPQANHIWEVELPLECNAD